VLLAPFPVASCDGVHELGNKLMEARRRLYRAFLRSSMEFTDYSTKSYFLRWSKSVFRSESLDLPVLEAELEVLKRQAVLQSLYPCEKSVIELKESQLKTND
jgi:hypothetical protein